MPPIQKQANAPSASVTCLPSGGLGSTMAGILFICGSIVLLLPAGLHWFSILGSYKPPPPTSALTYTFLAVIVGCLWSIAAAGVAHEKRACILADDIGLRWRDIGKWHTLRWDEIRAVTIELQGRGHKQVLIQGKKEILRIQDYGWSNAPALLEFVRQHAPTTALEDWHQSTRK